MFSSYAKVLLVLTAIAPVALVYAWVVATEGQWGWAALLLLIALALGATCNDLLIHADRRLERMEFKTASVEAADRENIAFLLLYLSPIFTSQFGALNVSVLFPTLVIFGVMSATGYNYHFNPLMGFLGWHFYRVTSVDAVTYILITKKQLRRSGEVTTVGQLTEYILIDLGSTMPVNLLAICKANDALVVKRVSVSADVQGLLEGVFVQQEQQFLEGITEEIAFDGGWNPEANELLKLPATPEVSQVYAACTGNVLALPVLEAGAIEGEGIRGLAVVLSGGGVSRLLLQNFDARQILQRHFALFLSGDTFNHLTAPAFSIASGLAGIVVGGEVKFRRFSKIRQIFDLRHLYIEATDAQVDAFTSHDSLAVDDPAAFRTNADQGIRKLINAIAHRGTLDAFGTDEICHAAEEEGLHIDRVGAKILLPMTRAQAKRVLHFLDDGYYRARLSGVMYITNSKRALAN